MFVCLLNIVLSLRNKDFGYVTLVFLNAGLF